MRARKLLLSWHARNFGVFFATSSCSAARKCGGRASASRRYARGGGDARSIKACCGFWPDFTNANIWRNLKLYGISHLLKPSRRRIPWRNFMLRPVGKNVCVKRVDIERCAVCKRQAAMAPGREGCTRAKCRWRRGGGHLVKSELSGGREVQPGTCSTALSRRRQSIIFRIFLFFYSTSSKSRRHNAHLFCFDVHEVYKYIFL